MIKNAFILNFFKLYNMLWSPALPFLRLNHRLQDGFNKRIHTGHLPKSDIWIQAASAGEAYLAVEIIKSLRPARPVRILATSMTRQGLDILKQNLGRQTIHPGLTCFTEWFVFDKPDTMTAAARKIDPLLVILLETEIWPALLYVLKKEKIPVAILNARLSRGSYNAYIKTAFLWKHLAPDVIAATSKRDTKRYSRLFVESRVLTMNNIKFETLIPQNDPATTSRNLEHLFFASIPLTILASIRRQEEADILDMIEALRTREPGQVIALFPRHMHRIDAWQKKLGNRRIPFRLRSSIDRPVDAPGLILWDRFGELKSAFAFAKTVFVGGSLKPTGGQNFIEPAAFGIPTVIGPYYDDFEWVGEDIFNQGIISKVPDVETAVNELLQNIHRPGKALNDSRKRLAAYLSAHRGGNRQACDVIRQFLKF